MNEIERWLVEHFERNGGLPPGESVDALLEVNYFDRRLLDSLGIVQMIVGLEEDFGVRLEREQMQDPRFCTIRGLGQIVAEARAKAGVSPADYDRDAVVAALREVGVEPGDAIFTHASVGMLGVPREGLDKDTIADLFLSAFREVLGPEGTWVLPGYTYSYTSGEPFDPASTPPGNMGLLSEVLWRHPDAIRSLDPIFSVIGFGGRAEELVARAGAEDCFGPDSFYARLLDADGAVCNIGIGSHAALIHHVEQKLGVPYRFIKRFRGTTVVDGAARETEVAYNVRALDAPRTVAYFMRLDGDGRADGSIASARVGRGEINLVRGRRMEELIRAGLERDPEYLVAGDLMGQPLG